MKTTIDLPEALVSEAKRRALRQRRPFKDLIAQYIREGLNETSRAAESLSPGVLQVDEDGLPVFLQDPDVPGPPPSLDDLLQLERESLQAEDRQRAGLPD
jgi:hypothetical protein